MSWRKDVVAFVDVGDVLGVELCCGWNMVDGELFRWKGSLVTFHLPKCGRRPDFLGYLLQSSSNSREE